MRVSVILPTYNRGYIVGDAIRSALDQTYCAFEILVVDDGSADDTPDTVKRFASSRLRYLRHEKNLGCSAAYNTGLSAATGTFVAFLDSDDIWKPSYLKRQTEFLSRHAELGAAFTDTEVQGADLHIRSLTALMRRFSSLLLERETPKQYVFTAREMYLCLLEEVPIKPSALVFRKDLYSQFGGFNEAWPSGTDWDLLLRFSHSARFGYINEPLVIQRRTADATHEIFREQDKLFLIDAFTREKAKLYGDHEALSAIDRGILSHYSDLGSYYLHSGKKRKAIAAYLKGFKETRQPAMALKAAYSCLPRGVIDLVRSGVTAFLGGQHAT